METGVERPPNMDAFVQRTLDLIEQSGHSITCVWGEPPFAYTVGLSTRTAHPYELATSCGDPDAIGALLNAIPEFLVDSDTQPTDGAILDGAIAFGYRVGLRRVLDTERFKVVRLLYGECPPVWQVLWPDIDNRLPGEEGYDAQRCPQEML